MLLSIPYNKISLPMKKMIIDFSQELTQSYYVKLLNDDAFNVFTKDILTENEMRYNGEKIIFLPEDYHLIDKALNQLGYKIERRRNPIKKSYDFFDLFFSNSEEIDKLRKHISPFMYMKYARLLSQNINNETFDNSSSDTSYSKLLYFLLDISDYFTSNHFDKKIDNAYIAEYIISVVDLLIPYKILGSLMTSYLYGIDNVIPYYMDGPTSFLYHKLTKFINKNLDSYTDNLSMFELKAAISARFHISNDKASPSDTIDRIMKIFEIYKDAKEISTDGILSVRDYLLSDYTIRESVIDNEPRILDNVFSRRIIPAYIINEAKCFNKEMVLPYIKDSIYISFKIPKQIKYICMKDFSDKFDFTVIQDSEEERLIGSYKGDDEYKNLTFLFFMNNGSLNAISLEKGENNKRHLMYFYDFDCEKDYELVSSEKLPGFKWNV